MKTARILLAMAAIGFALPFSALAGSLSLSQTYVAIGVGQTATVNIQPTGGQVANIVFNSSSNTVSAVVSGNTLTLLGMGTGSSEVRLCTSSNDCATVYVTVGSGGTGYGNITFSPSSVSMNAGGSTTVSIYNSGSSYYGSYYVSNNSNSSVASASISGNSLYLTANSSGSTNITVCQSGYSSSVGQCGTLYVTVSGGTGGSVTFSPASLNISAGTSQTVTIYHSHYYVNSGDSFYVSSNSNSQVASASVSGSSLYVNGLQNGSTNITVCNNSYTGCGTLPVTVTGTGYGNITFSPSSVSMNAGGSTTVSIYNSGSSYYGSYYVSNNSNSSVASASISGNSLYLTANSSGSTNITVCQSGYSSSVGQCGTLYVTVSGSSGGLWVSPSNLNLNLGQSGSVSVYGNSGSYYGSYYISNNSNSSVASASISGNTVYLVGNNYGTANITVCGNSGNYACANFTVTVGGGYGSLTFNAATLPQPVINQYYSYQLSVSNGSYPYTFYVYSGNLPNGLSLNNQGLIAGTPMASGTYTFQVRVQDNAGRSATQSFTTTVGTVSGASTFKNGALIRENGTIYTVYKNLKSGFANMDAFTGLGYKLSNVTDAGITSLSNSGYVIGTSQTAHPWGTWIKQGTTVYFVHENGLIPVSYYDVFLNNGGEDRMVVPANYYDFIGKQVLPVMSNNDWRLR